MYTPDGTTNLRKVLNKRCAQQSVYKTVLDSLRVELRSLSPRVMIQWVLEGGYQLYICYMFLQVY